MIEIQPPVERAILVSRIAGDRVWSWRNLVPPLFGLGVILLPVLSAIVPVAWILCLAMIGIYLALAIGFSVRQVPWSRDWRALRALVRIFFGDARVVRSGSDLGSAAAATKARGWANA